MRKIALDVGDKTVGIALSDELGITAQGLMTLERVGIRKDTGKILDLVKEYQCDTIVIGLPKNWTALTVFRQKKSMNSVLCWRTRCEVPA